MDYFWKENKKFVIAVGGALITILHGPSSPFRKDAVAPRGGARRRSGTTRP